MRLSWHILCYLISKNFYSLQNAQPFIFQLICMQLCKCINCFLKSHNKQLNQYCLNFTIFVIKKKKFLKNGSGSGQVDPQKTRVRTRVNPFLLRIKKKNNWVRVGSGRVRKFWPVLPCLLAVHNNFIFSSTTNSWLWWIQSINWHSSI